MFLAGELFCACVCSHVEQSGDQPAEHNAELTVSIEIMKLKVLELYWEITAEILSHWLVFMCSQCDAYFTVGSCIVISLSVQSTMYV